MKQKITRSNKLLWIALSLSVLLGFLWRIFPMEDSRVRLQSIPLKGLNFVGSDIDLTDEEKSAYQGATILKRMYHFEQASFMLLILDGTHNRQIIHDPIYCLRGSGFEIVRERGIQIPGGQVKLIRARKSSLETESIFWFSDGTTRHASMLKYWIQTTLRRLTMGSSGAEPLAVHLEPVNAEIREWEPLLTEIVRQLGL